ncbi:AAA family ATPase [Brevibacterium litoralis]|uniref:AAA family ATPase n=1 Tax=Brevibacterium litoralis TaxID=3138935 RepID=UPI0032EADE94
MTTDDWYIERLSLTNFRNLESTEIDLDRRLTLLVGRNGSGKTAVLDALAIMLRIPLGVLTGRASDLGSGDSPLHVAHTDATAVARSLDSRDAVGTVERKYPVRIAATGILDGARVEWDRALATPDNNSTYAPGRVREPMEDLQERAIGVPGGSGDTGFQAVLPVVAMYGVERLVRSRRGQGTIDASRLDAYSDALSHGSDLKRISEYVSRLDKEILRAQAFGDVEPRAVKRQFEAIDAACSSILEPVGWSSLRWNDTVGGLTLRDRDGLRLPLSSLASGARIAAGLAIDLASRMARANPHLGSSGLLESTPGIVLVDEIDLHLHPVWQQQIVPQLLRTFPRVQFVLTTHSPQVIGTVDPERIRILDGARVRVPDYSKGLRSDVVLHEVQGVDPDPDIDGIRRKKDRYLELVFDGDGHGDEAVQLRAELDELGGTERIEELQQADVHMAFEELD